VLLVASPGPPGTKEAVIDTQFTTNFLFNIGITRKLEFGAALPVTLGQSGSGLTPITGGESGLKPTALRDIRFGLAYALLRSNAATTAGSSLLDGFSVAARFFMSAPTAEGGGFAGETGAVFLPSISAEYRTRRFFAASELGLRLRSTTEFAGARVGSQGSAALGAGFDILPSDVLAAIAEIRVLPGFVKQSTLVQTSNGFSRELISAIAAPAEWSVGVRSAPLFGGDLAFQLMGGSGIPLSSDAALGTPRFRFTLGIRYAPINRDSDGDGITDKLDLCPNEAPGKLPPEAPRDGCPHAPDVQNTGPVEFQEVPALPKSAQ
jgi:OmpA-OmpF porin, OOP family